MSPRACVRCRRWRNVYLDTGLCAKCTIDAAEVVSLEELEERLEQHRRWRAEIEESRREHPSNGPKR